MTELQFEFKDMEEFEEEDGTWKNFVANLFLFSTYFS